MKAPAVLRRWPDHFNLCQERCKPSKKVMGNYPPHNGEQTDIWSGGTECFMVNWQVLVLSVDHSPNREIYGHGWARFVPCLRLFVTFESSDQRLHRQTSSVVHHINAQRLNWKFSWILSKENLRHQRIIKMVNYFYDHKLSTSTKAAESSVMDYPVQLLILWGRFCSIHMIKRDPF